MTLNEGQFVVLYLNPYTTKPSVAPLDLVLSKLSNQHKEYFDLKKNSAHFKLQCALSLKFQNFLILFVNFKCTASTTLCIYKNKY